MPIQGVPYDRIKPDPDQQIKGVLDQGINYFQKPEYFGKFRAYCFFNFIVIAAVLLLCTIAFFTKGETSAAMGCLMMTAFDVLICYLIWLPVKKKARPEERRVVFRGFFATSVLVFGKVLLFVLIITIPLAFRIGGENPYKYLRLENGTVVLARQKWNGQYEDSFGNIYEEK